MTVLPVELVEVTDDNWREIAAVAPRDDQREFVPADAAFYLLLGEREGVWRSLGIAEGGRIVGHVMWAVDDADASHWIGGLMIAAGDQGRGLGRSAVVATIAYLRERGAGAIRLSHLPSNTAAAALYGSLGFLSTGQVEEDELVLELPPA